MLVIKPSKAIVLFSIILLPIACGGSSGGDGSPQRDQNTENEEEAENDNEETSDNDGNSNNNPIAGCDFKMNCVDSALRPISNETNNDTLAGVWFSVTSDYKDQEQVSNIEIFTVEQSANVITSYSCAQYSHEQDPASRTPFGSATITFEIDGETYFDSDEGFSNTIYKNGVFIDNREYILKDRDTSTVVARAFKISDQPFTEIGLSDDANPLYCMYFVSVRPSHLAIRFPMMRQ